MLTYTLKIDKLQKETDDTVTILFKQPALKKIKYKAGQYLTLIFRINGRRYIRPYSFSSAPEVDNTLNVTIKRVLNGVVSNHILDKVKQDDLIEVMSPLGDFTLDNIRGELEKKHVVLWGSGSGITPLISIAKYALAKTNCRHITLVYGNRSFETTIFSAEINDIKKAYPTRFSVWHFHTRSVVDEADPYVIQGRIDPDKVLSIMKAEGKMEDTAHYICGPFGLKESVKSELIKIGVTPDHIFSEDFEVNIDPVQLNDIATENVTVILQNKKTVFEVAKGKSILEAGLDAMLELPYSCQTGSCLLCKAELLTGKIKTIGIEKKPDGLLDNEYLLCCGFPRTNDVELLIKD
jgi:ring-1,2-phenylacetyl-CoA epoxidase subunit PaaE